MALAVDISRAVRSRAQQHELVRAVFDSAQDEQETHYMEWKGSLNLVGKDATGRATIAKAVLGFANRDPNAASRAMGGCAYLLVGVSPGQLTGVEAVDGAQLEARVATYVGRNVDWRADYPGSCRKPRDVSRGGVRDVKCTCDGSRAAPGGGWGLP